jgi:hypothetical protein
MPYPVIVSMSSDLKKGTKTVKVDGKKPAAVKGSEFSRCSGDEPGTAGGVKSSTNMKEATWLLYSFDVKLDGKNACRLSDKMMMNHGNTACLMGVCQQHIPGENIEDDRECDKATEAAKDANELVKNLKSAEESYVVAGGSFVPASGRSYSMRGASLISSGMIIPGGRYKKFSKAIEKGTTSNIPGQTYTQCACAKEGHAEAKIIEALFSGRIWPLKSNAPKPPGKLYLQLSGKPGKPVCCHCQKMITNAQKAGLEVILCSPSTEDDCKPGDDEKC